MTSEANSDFMELQTIWNNATNNVSITNTSNNNNNTNNNNNNQSLQIPKYNYNQSTELTKPLLNKPKLPILFEQILQNYLNTNNNNINNKYLNVLILLDISLTISTNTESIDESLYHLIINLLHIL